MQVFMLARLYCKAISAALFQTLDSAVVEKPTVVRGGVAGVTDVTGVPTLENKILAY